MHIHQHIGWLPTRKDEWETSLALPMHAEAISELGMDAINTNRTWCQTPGCDLPTGIENYIFSHQSVLRSFVLA